GGKVLVPTSQFVRTLSAARLAADVLDVPSVLVARTDALSAALLTSDIDDYDREFVTGERTAEGFFRVRDGIDAAIARGLAYAPYADLVWFETSTPDLGEARDFALEEFGYTATRHQREVGAGYFDLVTQAVSPDSSTLALKGSTEEAQFSA